MNCQGRFEFEIGSYLVHLVSTASIALLAARVYILRKLDWLCLIEIRLLVLAYTCISCVVIIGLFEGSGGNLGISSPLNQLLLLITHIVE